MSEELHPLEWETFDDRWPLKSDEDPFEIFWSAHLSLLTFLMVSKKADEDVYHWAVEQEGASVREGTSESLPLAKVAALNAAGRMFLEEILRIDTEIANIYDAAIQELVTKETA